MRTNKFRGFDRGSGLWRVGSLLVNGEICFIVQFIQGEEVRWEIDPKTVGQFTGLRDKNGRDIYEGDILKIKGERSRLEVSFVRGVFAFLWNGDLDDEFPCNAPTHEWAKVIGNIHDNPELLKKTI